MNRTAFGRRDRCPACDSLLAAAPEDPLGETHCPRCSVRLWFINFPTAGCRYMVRTRQPLVDALAQVIEPSNSELANALRSVSHGTGMDSLDWVELMAEVEAFVHDSSS